TAQNVDANDPTGSRTMGYYTAADLPYYYALYNTFATGDRYFCSVLTQTFPNRMYLLAGSSYGHIRNDSVNLNVQPVFNLLDNAGVSWKIYASQYPLAYGRIFFTYVASQASTHIFPMTQYFTDLNNGTLPSVAFVDPKLLSTPTLENDEH